MFHVWSLGTVRRSGQKDEIPGLRLVPESNPASGTAIEVNAYYLAKYLVVVTRE